MNVPEHLVSELADFRSWKRDSQSFDLLDYAGCVLTPDVLISVLSVVEPTLVVHDGEYFLASHFDPATYDSWLEKLGTKVKVQRMMNHIHISTLLQDQQISDALAVFVAEQIARLWSLVLASKGLIGEASGDSLEDVTVTFYRRSGDRDFP
jgi:hypothetical protein